MFRIYLIINIHTSFNGGNVVVTLVSSLGFYSKQLNKKYIALNAMLRYKDYNQNLISMYIATL